MGKAPGLIEVQIEPGAFALGYGKEGFMQFLEKLDKGIDTFLKYFTGVLMVLLTIIVCAMVISRYVFRIQLGGIEELPVYFMCVSFLETRTPPSQMHTHMK